MAKRAETIDKELIPVNVPLNGKCITAVDPANIGPGNFQTLINLRPGPTNPEPIQGMTKINTAALANPNFKTGIHFRKDKPGTESHVLVHARDASSINGKVYRNSATVPAQGAFTATALFSDTNDSGTPRFSLAPLGMAVYCNGTDSVVWPGLEARCAGFIDYNPDKSYRYNYTRQVTNDLTDANNLATVHRYADTVDANTMLLLHLDNNVTDSSPTTPHTVTNNNVTFSTSTKKMGTHAAYFNGTSARLSIPDNADFDLSGGTWTIDFWIRLPDITDSGQIYYQGTDANNYIFINYNGTTRRLHFGVTAAGTPAVEFNVGSGPFLVDTWHHVAVVENGDDYYIFIDGVLRTYVSDIDRPANYTGSVFIGSDSTPGDYLEMYLDEIRVSNSARWTSAFEPPTQAYGQGNVSSFYVGGTLPAQGINWYVQTANATPGAAVIYYWNGTAWVSAGTITGVGATPFSTTGKHTWTFASTAATAKPRILDGAMAYWYKVEITEVDTATQFYQVTLDCAMQQIRDLWSGTYQRISSFQKYQTNAYNDLTTGVFKEEWDSSNTATFAEIDSLPTTTGFLLFGFTGRMQALRIALIGGHVNTAAGTVMTIEYYNGTTWVSVGTIDDGTVENGISFAKSGVVSWNPPELASEFETDLPGSSRPIFSREQLISSMPASDLPWRFIRYTLDQAEATGAKTIDRPSLYYYRVSFSTTLSADVQLYFVGGIPVQRDLSAFDFSFSHLNRLWLVKDNTVLASAQDTAQVFNGDDTLEFPVGGDAALVGAASLTTRVGNSVYAVLLLFKKSEVWVMLGSDPAEMVGPLRIASSIGLTAPETLAVIPSYELGPGISRPIAVWQASDGIYMCDGFSVNPFSGDIADRFDDRKSTCINRTYIASSFGAYDEKYGVYHWNYAEGAATAPDQEWGYRFGRSSWFEIDRTAAKRLTCMIPVKDASGNSYMYAGMAGGYLMRLENGPTFDSVNIPYSFRPGDLALVEGSLAVESQLRYIKLVMAANNSTANTVAVTHYVDGDTNGKTVAAMAPQITNRRTASVVRSVNHDGVLHSTLFSLSSDLGTAGFEPLYLTYYIKPKALDKGFSVNTPVSV